jgi:predicted Zn finger-like uncharacterized protein
MKISCQSCQAKYTIADEKVVGKIVKIRCKKCGATIVINGNEGGSASQGNTAAADGNAFDYAGGGAAGDAWTVNVADGDQRTMTLDELTAAYRSGVVTDDTYCWKDGMADWLPVREVPELAGARAGSPDQTQQEQPGAGGYPTPPPPSDEATHAGYSGYDAPAAAAAAAIPAPPASANGNGAGMNGLFGSTPPPAAARRQGARPGGGADLFGSVAQAGGEEDVMTSAPAGMPQPSNDPSKLTGQRNENSVLFSLSALTQNAPAEAPAAAAGGGEGSGLIDIRALSASMGSTDKAKSTHVDDIMNLGGGGAFSAALTAPVLSPPMADVGGLGLGGDAPRKDKTMVIVAGIIGGAVVIALAIIIVFVLKKPDQGTATATTGDSTAAPATSAPAVVASTAPSAAPPPADSASAAAAPAGAAPPSVGGNIAAAPAKTHHGGGGGGGGGGSPPPFVAPSPAPATGGGGGGGGGNSLDAMMKSSVHGGDAPPAQAPQASSAPFDRGAAAAALGAVSVSGCKKSDGPTGSGHIRVTFAPNGSVQSAVVDQPPFAGTPVGGCVMGKFRSAHIPAFAGAPVSVGKSFIVE